MSDTYQIWLGATGCSKRAIRYKQLSPDAVDSIAVEAASGPAAMGMTAVSYQIAVQGLAVGRMIMAYTEPLLPVQDPPGEDGALPALKDPDLNDPALRWVAMDVTVSAMSIAKSDLFTAKDIAILNKLYTRLHEANMFEVEAVLGKAQTVRTA